MGNFNFITNPSMIGSLSNSQTVTTSNIVAQSNVLAPSAVVARAVFDKLVSSSNEVDFYVQLKAALAASTRPGLLQ